MLSPYLVGPSVGLHPVWLMFALFAFGYLFGFVGLIVAIPVAAAVGVLVRFAMQRYLASRSIYGDRHALTCPRLASLRLRWVTSESFAREDFLAGPQNAAALALIERWPEWPARDRCCCRA